MIIGRTSPGKATSGGMGIAHAVALLCLLTATLAMASGAHQSGKRPPLERDPGGGLPASKANKAIEVGHYYFKKGKYDAAIDRFKEAIGYRPSFGLPHRLIGEAYEKKKFKPEAIEWYEKYLQVQPGAPDADKIRKRIEALRHEVQQDEEKRKEKSRPN